MITRILLIAAALATGLPVCAQELPQESPPLAAKSAKGAADGRRTLKGLPAAFGRGITGVFARQSITPLLVGTAGTALARNVDDEFAPLDGSDSQLGEVGAGFGNPLYVGGAAVAMFVGGRLATGQRFRDVSYDLLVASGVNFLYTEALKQTFPRERPDGENNKSFPSGHTSNAFAWASVLDKHFGIGLGAPMYMVASTIAASRVTAGKHYLSDVIAGATIGFIVGRAVTRRNNEPVDQPGWTLAPTTGPRGQPGVLLVIRF